MTQAWLGVLGSVIVAALAFVFGRVNLESATKAQREEELRRRRVDTYAAFCVAVIEYRRAQLHRWYVGDRVGGNVEIEAQRPEVAEDVRLTRAEAWGQFYQVLMVCSDEELVGLARDALRLTRRMKESSSAKELDDLSNQVHTAVHEFAIYAGRSALASKARVAVPPAHTPGL